MYLAVNQRLSPQSKFDAVVEMYETITASQAAQERQLHPDENERGIFLRVAARRLGPALVKRIYGWPYE